LTERYLELRQHAFRTSVDMAIEQGEIILSIQRRVGGGLTAWLTRVGTRKTTAYNHAALARLAKEQPSVIQDWKELGPSKLYKIAKLPAPSRQKVLRAGAAKLRGSSDEEFAEMVAPFTQRKRKVTPDMRAHGFRMRVRAWGERARQVRIDGVEDDVLKADLRREIDALFEVLREVRKRLSS
jgi:hypothetical protein